MTVERADRLFKKHLAEAFGERAADFSVQLRGRLRTLWNLALETRLGPERTARDEDDFIKIVPDSMPDEPPAPPTGKPKACPPSSDPEDEDPTCPECLGLGWQWPGVDCIWCNGTGEPF